MPPVFEDNTAQAWPALKSDILAGEDNFIHDAKIAAGLTLAIGQLLGFEYASGARVAFDNSVQVDALTTDGSTKTFDLGSANVLARTISAIKGSTQVGGTTLSRGTGADGVDQIVFATAPASGTVNVSYQTSAAIPSGVLLEAVDTSGGAAVTAAVVETGGVLADKVVGAPYEAVKGAFFGLLYFA